MATPNLKDLDTLDPVESEDSDEDQSKEKEIQHASITHKPESGLTTQAIELSLLLRSAFRSVSLFMIHPRRYFAIYANIMCILLCLLVHVIPKAMRCQDRWLAISVVFFVTAIMLFVVRPHRAILSSLWSGVCYVLLGILTILETIGVLAPSVDVQTMKVVIIVALIILVVARTVYTIYIWYLERKELQTVERPEEPVEIEEATEVEEVEEQDAVEAAVVAEEVVVVDDDLVEVDLDADRMIEEFVAPVAPGAFAAMEIDEHSLLEVTSVQDTGEYSDKEAEKISVHSSLDRPQTIDFEPSIPKESETNSSAIPVEQEDDDEPDVLFDAVESHHPSERASIASEEFEVGAGADHFDDDYEDLDAEDESNDEDFATAAAAAWDDAIDHFGDDIDAAAQVVVPNIATLVQPKEGPLGADLSDESSIDLASAHSESSAESELRNVDEGDGCDETEFY